MLGQMIESAPEPYIQAVNTFVATLFVYYGILNPVASIVNHWAEGRDWLKYAIDTQEVKVRASGIDSYTREQIYDSWLKSWGVGI